MQRQILCIAGPTASGKSSRAVEEALARSDRLILLSSQKDDLDLRTFVDQLLLAKSWYHGYDDSAMESYMADLITSVNEGTDPNTALGLAARRVQETLKKP